MGTNWLSVNNNYYTIERSLQLMSLYLNYFSSNEQSEIMIMLMKLIAIKKKKKSMTGLQVGVHHIWNSRFHQTFIKYIPLQLCL